MIMKKIIYIGMMILIGLQLCGCADITINGKNGELENTATSPGIGYDQYDEYKYSIGNAKLEENINSLDIDWLTGEVEISYHNENTIEITENAKKELNESEKLRYYYDGNTLYIKYCKAKFNCNKLNKKLSVVLPKDIKLNDFNLDSASANLTFDTLKTNNFECDLATGSITGNILEADHDVKVDTASGKFIIKDEIVANSVSYNAAAGTIELNNAEIKDEIDMNTTSGNAQITLASMCDVSYDATAGNILLKVPENASFRFEQEAVCGSVNIEIPMEKLEDEYRIGDGKYQVSSQTVTGNTTIQWNK